MIESEYSTTMRYCNTVYNAVQALITHNVTDKLYLNPIYGSYFYKFDIFYFTDYGVSRQNHFNGVWFNFYPGRNSSRREILMRGVVYNLDDYLDSTEEDIYFQYSLVLDPSVLEMLTLFRFLLKKKCKKFKLDLTALNDITQNIKVRNESTS